MEMKKYMTPEMEVVEIKVQGSLLIISGDPTPGKDDTEYEGDE